ncbi:MAG: isoprenyl transferase [Flammeovirgaceae bacterium]|nr:isoprenyl transferase [Flammeovirgaceae bacterium]MBE63845.1 isoprenyl transferase [Flammeovirgaceae bacterium]HCX23209.1 isoprenyl transferase [Cytophagales bacterium]|tara:strand:- start:4965 stop:5702 length:738 start_codon:yes stop_codon:yes gene_type:complete
MKEQINSDNLPRHIAVIMDGNGRWAKKKGAARIFGHKNAIKAVQEVTEGCAELEIECLTLYAFSTENWARPKVEVAGLMSLLVSTIKDEMPTLMKNNISLHSIGDRSQLPEETRTKLESAIDQTKENSGLKLILALNYSGKWDLTNAMREMALDVSNGKLVPDCIDQEKVSEYLSTAEFPDPELLIRTSGEMRISNFLLWQLAYTELFFTPVLWPDFRKEHLHEAILAYQGRERRFGKISEQVNL